VHALKEIVRVVVPGGALIDLRPLCDRWPVEVAWSDGFLEAGRVTDLEESLAADRAANKATFDADASGVLHRERDEYFPFFYYWDTAKEMQDYIAQNWEDVISVEDDVWAKLRSLWTTANADARARLRMKMLITRYRVRE